MTRPMTRPMTGRIRIVALAVVIAVAGRPASQAHGENFFKRLEAMLPDLRRNLETAEVCYFCLALGFQGRYRISGQEVLPNVVRNLLKRIEAIKGAPPGAISPSAKVHHALQGRGSGGKPLIIASAVFLAISAILFALLMAASDGALEPARTAVERLQTRTPAP